MKPDYSKAASMASKILIEAAISSAPFDILPILKSLPNVFVVSLDVNSIPGKKNWDAFTCVRKKEGKLQYIVIYNNNLPEHSLNLALARELGHVVLQHDGSSPEEVWMEEATCFAYHMICPKQMIKITKTIYYRPHYDRISASFKDMLSFNSIDSLREYIAKEKTKFYKYIGKTDICTPGDVEITNAGEDIFGGWKNYSNVVLDGKVIGFCGE